jgi:hypothetical protein
MAINVFMVITKRKITKLPFKAFVASVVMTSLAIAIPAPVPE